MNKCELEYSSLLEAQKQAGEILHWQFEPIKFRLADRTFYTPDFMVVTNNHFIEFHETKGRPGSGPGGWMEDARVKIKVAAEQYPWFEFVGMSRLPKKSGGGWKEERF